MPKYRLLFTRKQVFTVLVEAGDEDAAWLAAKGIEGQVYAKADPYEEDIGWHKLNLFSGSVQGVQYRKFEAYDTEEVDES